VSISTKASFGRSVILVIRILLRLWLYTLNGPKLDGFAPFSPTPLL
jgi:hypothetical protein